MARRLAAREPCHCKIEAAPEEVHRTALSEKTRTELLEHAIDLQEYAPEALSVFAIVRRMRVILAEGNGLRHFIRHFIDTDRQPQARQRRHHGGMELGYRLRLERHLPPRPVARVDPEDMIEKIKIDLKRTLAIRDK
jgi:hypothetical protein